MREGQTEMMVGWHMIPMWHELIRPNKAGVRQRPIATVHGVAKSSIHLSN